jgi:tetratricopeptide (TPR) repeat protein
MFRRTTFIIAALLALTAFTAFAQESNEAKKLFNEGNAKLKAGDFSGAIAKYDAALAIEKHPFFYYQRGLAQKKSRKYDESIASFEAAVKLDPKFAAGYNALGGAYFSKNDFEKAIDSYSKALQENPTLGPSKKGLAASLTAAALDLIGKGESQKAVDYAKRAIENDTKFGKAYIALAQAYNKEGKYGEAASAAQDAVKYGKAPNGAAYFELGIAYRNSGKMEEAKKAFLNAKKDATYARNAQYELEQLK